MQRYLIATATGILVLTLGGCAVAPLDDDSYRHQRHADRDNTGWNNDRYDNRGKWDRNRDRDRTRWNRDRDRNDYDDWHDDRDGRR